MGCRTTLPGLVISGFRVVVATGEYAQCPPIIASCTSTTSQVLGMRFGLGYLGAKSMFETLVLWFVPIWGVFLAQLVRRNQSWIIVPMGNHDFVRIINETYSGAESLVQSRANPTARPTDSIWAPLDAN